MERESLAQEEQTLSDLLKASLQSEMGASQTMGSFGINGRTNGVGMDLIS